MRILADRVIADAQAAFSVYGEVVLFDGRELTPADAKNADILLVRSVTKIDASFLDNTSIKFVGSATAGVDHIATDQLAALGIPFASAPGCNANAVAEFVVTTIVSHCQKHQIEPSELTVGVIGHGAVGQRLTKKLDALSISYLLNDPPREQQTAEHPYVALSELSTADVVTVHTPLTDSGAFPTLNLLNNEVLQQMASCRLLINAARGGIVDEQAILARLAKDSEFKVAIDCWQNEPQFSNLLLEQCFVASPHVAGHTMEARLNATRMLCVALNESLGMANPWLEDGAKNSTEYIDRVNFRSLGDLPELLARCCPIHEIDTAMRALQVTTGKQRSVAFDQLRKASAGRREFSHYLLTEVLKNVDVSDTLARSLTGLEFEI